MGLQGIDQYTPAINAVSACDAAAAEAQARGERKPLLGAPISLRENFQIAG
ncbi:hypothetical protein [Lampropedia aestuarii]|uniref:hypothetical protein n=1 Tax=Lampropedia aestuarii TaxID=2562762 RepID=UPI002468F589|nr:hypothetical protein [Lampropedia aestuarii]MDH5858136.1 hypothetical protein [Lampropedia aestuarii]